MSAIVEPSALAAFEMIARFQEDPERHLIPGEALPALNVAATWFWEASTTPVANMNLLGFSVAAGLIGMHIADASTRAAFADCLITVCARDKLLGAKPCPQVPYNLGVVCEHMSLHQTGAGKEKAAQGYRAFAGEYYRLAFALLRPLDDKLRPDVVKTLHCVQNPTGVLTIHPLITMAPL